MFRFTTRGSGANARPRTEIDMDVPPSYPLASAARVAEVAALEALRAARARRHKVMVFVIMVVILTVWLAMVGGLRR